MGELLHLIQLRKDRRLTQEKLAEMLDVSIAQYRRYESGESSPRIESLKYLANLFHVSIDYLVGYVPDDYSEELSHAEKQRTDESSVPDVDFLMRLSKEGKDADGMILEVIDCFYKCEEKQKEHFMYFAEQLANLAVRNRMDKENEMA